MVEIRAEKVIAAEPLRVWEVLADHEGMSNWLNVHKVIRRRPGSPDPNGVGAVRVLYGPFNVMEERIVVFQPGRRMEYDVLKGAPGWTAHGQITLTPTVDGGTLVWWRVTLYPFVPATAWAIRAILSRSLQSGLERLKERIEPERLVYAAGDGAGARSQPAAVPSKKRVGVESPSLIS